MEPSTRLFGGTEGNARTPYEFGVKVSITTTHKEGLVIGARSMPGNPYDGHTLAEALEQAAILSDVKPEVAVVDRGYKVVFDKDMQTGTDLSMMIQKKQNRATRFRRERNVWILDAIVDAVDDSEDFQRHP